jgi:large subunit ribosomal protein L25
MTTSITLTAQSRDNTVTPKALRRSQTIPGVVYGHGFAAQSLQFPYLPLARALQRAGTSQMIMLSIEGQAEAQATLVRDIQRDPITGQITHVDLYALVAGEKVRIQVPIVQRGRAPVEEAGGIIVQILESLEVECLPQDMPEAIEVDLSTLTDMGSRVTVADLPIPPGVTLLSDLDLGVIHVGVPRKLVEEEAAAEEAAPAATSVEAEEEDE